MKRFALVAAMLSACSVAGGYSASTPNWVADTTSFTPAGSARRSIADDYREVAARIIAAARADHSAYDRLSTLTDTVGNRLSGSPSLDKAIAWAVQALTDDGFKVETEKVMVPHWQRGTEEAALIAPFARPLNVLGLGGSVATPAGGIAANAIVVHSWDELESRKADVNGKIVVFDVAMPAWSAEHGSGYGETVQYRTQGASRAAKYGAVAVLVRPVTAHSLGTPHTGAMSYDKDQPKIPPASITVEDAELLDRLAARGSALQIRLRLESQWLPDAPSANVIAELRGRERPDEIVLLAAHLDSWDVGQGAQDDGGGVVAMMQALRTLKALDLAPRRTVRLVLFTNEENGLRGGKGYAADHASEVANHVAALESDSGSFAPVGFGVDGTGEAADRVRARLADVASLLRGKDFDATRIGGHGGGADISPLKPAGVPQIALEVDGRAYFDVHHTRADTLDKVEPQALADMAAVAAVFAYVVADMPERLDAPFSAVTDTPTPAPATPFETRSPAAGPPPVPASTTPSAPFDSPRPAR
jgi:carboxypeptidase Q